MWPSSVDYTTSGNPGVPLYDADGLLNVTIQQAALDMPSALVANPMTFYTDGSKLDGNLWNANGANNN